jgi:hypothetical protein
MEAALQEKTASSWKAAEFIQNQTKNVASVGCKTFT